MSARETRARAREGSAREKYSVNAGVRRAWREEKSTSRPTYCVGENLHLSFLDEMRGAAPTAPGEVLRGGLYGV